MALDLAIDEDLLQEGRAREIVHAVQNARKNAGLAVEDRVHLALDGDSPLIAAARAHRDYIAGETLAVELVLVDERAVVDAIGLAVATRWRWRSPRSSPAAASSRRRSKT